MLKEWPSGCILGKLTFTSYHVTVNTKEGVGTILQNIYGTHDGPESKSDKKRGQQNLKKKKKIEQQIWEDGGKIGRSGVHFPSTPVKWVADLRNKVNSQKYSSIYEDWRPKTVEDIEKSDGKKSA